MSSGGTRPRGADDVEGVCVVTLPDVVEYEEGGLLFEEFAECFLSFRRVLEGGVVAQLSCQLALQASQIGGLAESHPEDAVGKGPADLRATGQCAGQHAFADAAHALDADAGGCPGDDDRFLEVDEEQVAKGRDAIGQGAEVGRQLGHGYELADARRIFGQLASEVLEVLVVVRVIAEVFGMEQLDVFGNQLVAIGLFARGCVAVEADDRVDALVGLEVGEPPFLPDVVGGYGLWSDDPIQAGRTRLRRRGFPWWNVSWRDGMETRSNQTSKPRSVRSS